MSRVVLGARFQTAGRMYFFEPGPVEDVAINEWVIVQTELGQDAAKVQILPTDSPLVQVDPPLGQVLRKATATDKFELAKHKRREADSAQTAKEIAHRLGLDVKILGTDWQFDGGNVVVFYSADSTGLDLSPFSVELAAQLGTRVELRKLGARDETKVMTGVGTCGLELCCSSWLDKFSNISIRMAKEQDLPLNQSKLTGVCGRLKCCLIYELETYQEVKGKLPKLGDTFHIPSCVGGSCGTGGCAQVQGVSMTKEAITVGMIDGGRATMTAEELGVTFDAVPAHTKGVGSYGSDEIPRQERPTPVAAPGGGPRKRRRRGGRRRGGRPGGPGPS
ncbi:MAG TPA: regulatory iron-sulfur-containing complex subunit RicT [Candidatus Limnocylindria bacterium]